MTVWLAYSLAVLLGMAVLYALGREFRLWP